MARNTARDFLTCFSCGARNHVKYWDYESTESGSYLVKCKKCGSIEFEKKPFKRFVRVTIYHQMSIFDILGES